jgi:hypothetical protein
MKKLNCAAALYLAIASTYALELLATKEGTTWEYEVTEETAGLTSPGTPTHSQVTRRLKGTEQFEGKELLKLETLVGNTLSKTELVAVDENGIRCFARSGPGGKITALTSPQIIVQSQRLRCGRRAPSKEGSSFPNSKVS